MFNPSKKVLTETEVRVLEKGLGFAPTPTKINDHLVRVQVYPVGERLVG